MAKVIFAHRKKWYHRELAFESQYNLFGNCFYSSFSLDNINVFEYIDSTSTSCHLRMISIYSWVKIYPPSNTLPYSGPAGELASTPSLFYLLKRRAWGFCKLTWECCLSYFLANNCLKGRKQLLLGQMSKFLNSSAVSVPVSERAYFLFCLTSWGRGQRGIELDLLCLSKSQANFALSS